MKRYLVVGGVIPSKADGDFHYISPQKLIRLYEVPRHECILAMDWDDKASLVGLDITKYTVLEPDYHGNYNHRVNKE